MPHAAPQPKPMQTVKGIPVSPGIVIGRVFVLGEAETHVPHHAIDAADIDAELGRLDAALRDTVADLVLLRDRTEQQLGREAAKIFGFHLGLAQDPSLLGPMRDRVRGELSNAEMAVAESFKKVTEQFKAIGNEVFRQKANDVLDLERRVLGKLMGENESRLSKLSESVIVIAHELTPSQTAGMDRSKVLGIATDLGGRTSHTSIVARAV
ncbi:MAG: Phosphoenolpyruvate-protein phosphotransferase, partial [Planctomycetota bacterium]